MVDSVLKIFPLWPPLDEVNQMTGNVATAITQQATTTREVANHIMWRNPSATHGSER